MSLRRPPRALVAVLVVGLLHAWAWAVVTPAFQGPDEIVQFGYADIVAQTGLPPTAPGGDGVPSPQAAEALVAIPWTVPSAPRWSPDRSAALRRALPTYPATPRPGQAGYQSGNPPLYGYLLAPSDVVVRAAGGDVLDRLLVMRLVSGLLMLVVVGGTFGFLRELLPGHPRAAGIGALAVALQPMLGFVLGTVNNDAPVYAFGTLLLWAVARTFRRGVDARRVVAAAAALLGALLSKVSGIGLAVAAVPLALGTVLATPRRTRRRASIAVVVSVLLVGTAWAVARALQRIPYVATPPVTPAAPDSGVATAVVADAPVYSAREALGYLWQFYLPRPPFLNEVLSFRGTYPVWDAYLEAFAGRFGWFSFGFGSYVTGLYALLLGAMLVLALVAIARRPGRLNGRRLEAAAYAGSFGLFLLFVNLAGYKYAVDAGAPFEQVRYLFPFIAFYGALVALAIVGAGRRATSLEAFVAVGGALHVLAGLLLSLEHYYL